MWHWITFGAGKGKLQKVKTKCWSKHETGNESAPAGDDECRVGGTVQLHFLCCENEHEIRSLANISAEEQALQAALRGWTPLWLSACSPPSLALPLELAAPPRRADGTFAGVYRGSPWDPAGWEPRVLSPVPPGPAPGTAGKEREQSLQYSQSQTKQVWLAAEQVPTKGLERAWKPAYF